ncbi:hypothetical protein BIW11_09341 [Tropilaelaps mercedesae]|uniref:Uncharacterized protein n=1 Tax=Tropilaelaps mercedesae TaxID=418985 RepID=A0A1V9XL40_9ACAR|nr:hypothetical protein BIW11_09341 [Tropilaelaps mercedesae]
MYDKRRSRTYRLNYEIGHSLYSKQIADLNARIGSTSTSLCSPHWSARDDMYIHESIYGKRSRDLLRNDWRHTAHFHDRIVTDAMPTEDFSKYWKLDGTYWRRLWPSTDSFGRTHAGETVRWVEQARTREKHLEWQRQRERERRDKLRDIYTPERPDTLYKPKRHLSVKW